jgi:hypothetical protein
MWVQQGDTQLLGEDNWGNPLVNGHFSLELEDMVGQGNPLVENTLWNLHTYFVVQVGENEATFH